MPEQNLLPCPFCGIQEAETIHCEEECCGARPRWIQCKCGCELGRRWNSDDEAASDWNTRVVDGHRVVFHWERPGVIGPTATWVVFDEGYMYGPCEDWRIVEKIIREEWRTDRCLVG